ncbi:MAG: hypothetical protein ACRDVL_02070 [Acidimicrobiia bacterium]
MSDSEPARHALYSRLQNVLGDEHADTLMTYLPTDHSDEVATKADIGNLEDRFDRLEDRFDRLEDLVRDQQRFYVATTVGSMTALTGIFSLVVAMLG